MKICLINSLFYPDTKGGVETMVSTLANELDKNHDVFVICSGKEKKKTIEEKYKKIKIYRIGYEKYFPFQEIEKQSFFVRLLWRIHQLNNKYSSTTIFQILSQEKPDLILSHNTLGLGYNIIKTINKYTENNKSKHIATIHDVQLLYPSGILTEENKNRNILLRIYSYFTKNTYKSCKYIVSPSQALIKLYTINGFFTNSEINILANPIKLKVLSENKKTHSGILKITYLGQLEKHKGIYDIIKAIRLLDQNKFFLTIAGSGTESDSIHKIIYILSNIQYIGKYNNHEVENLLKETDVVVVPSKCFENSPMVIYEAWAHGVPVLASNIGGIPELIENNKTGWLYKSSDINDLKNKLLEVYNKKDELDLMSQNCKEKIKDFDVQHYINKLLKI